MTLSGFTVEEATDGRDGLQKAPRSFPDVIITDLEMPVMDGWETIRSLKSNERTRNIPVIVCSGRGYALGEAQLCARVRRPPRKA